METYVYEALLVEKRFVLFTHKLFATSFHAKAYCWLDKDGSRWKVPLSFHLFQILLHFRLVSRV
jgi:hypothetical protein